MSVKHWKDAEGTIAPITPKGVVGREEVADEKASVIGYSRVADKGWVDEEAGMKEEEQQREREGPGEGL